MKKAYASSVIKHIDPKTLEKMKISFLFSSVLIVSTLLGIFIANYASASIYPNSVFLLSNHFETAFLRCTDFLGCVKIIALYSLSDIVLLLIIFAVSFSMLNYLLTDIVLFLAGVKFGISVAFLLSFARMSNLPYSVGNIRIFLFIASELLILALLLYYSYSAAISALSFRETNASGRPDVKARDFLLFSLKTAACVGAILILNAIYCFLLYVLK